MCACPHTGSRKSIGNYRCDWIVGGTRDLLDVTLFVNGCRFHRETGRKLNLLGCHKVRRVFLGQGDHPSMPPLDGYKLM
jgi:hypothetical protein